MSFSSADFKAVFEQQKQYWMNQLDNPLFHQSPQVMAFAGCLIAWSIAEIIKQFRKGLEKANTTQSARIQTKAPSKKKAKSNGDAGDHEDQKAGKDEHQALSKEYTDYELSERHKVSPNTSLYTFKLPSPDQTLGLPIGQHIQVMAEVNGKEVSRSYTPVSGEDDKGHFDLMIKTYPNGAISGHMDKLKVGDKMKIKGPKGQMNYKPNLVKEMGMIAGGTGITPMLQIIRASLRDKSDQTKLSLIFANVVPSDILLRDELEKLAEEHKDRFHLYLVLNEPEDGWKGGKGFVNADMIKEHLPAPANDMKMLLCGPPPMINAMKKSLLELGYEKPRPVSKMDDQVFCF